MDLEIFSLILSNINESQYTKHRFNIKISLEDKNKYDKQYCCDITSDGKQCSRRLGYMDSKKFCGLHLYDEESTSRKISETINILTDEDNFSRYNYFINSYNDVIHISDNHKTKITINNNLYILNNLTGVIYQELPNSKFKRICKLNQLKCEYAIV